MKQRWFCISRQIPFQQLHQRPQCVLRIVTRPGIGHGGLVKHAQVQFIICHHIEALAHPHQATGGTQVGLAAWVLGRVYAQSLDEARR